MCVYAKVTVFLHTTLVMGILPFERQDLYMYLSYMINAVTFDDLATQNNRVTVRKC